MGHMRGEGKESACAGLLAPLDPRVRRLLPADELGPARVGAEVTVAFGCCGLVAVPCARRRARIRPLREHIELDGVRARDLVSEAR